MSRFLSVAKGAAKKAGDEVLRRYFRKGVSRTIKADNSPVTAGDHAANRIIVSAITKAFPDHTIISEESKHPARKSPYTWYIDPIDGTSNFFIGDDNWGVSIGLWKGEEAVAGVVYLPAYKQLFWAERGKGAYLNGARITPIKTPTNELGFIRSREASAREASSRDMKKAEQSSFTGRLVGSAVYELVLQAQGKRDATIFHKLQQWDMAAGLIIAMEAGCIVEVTRKDKVFLRDDFLIAKNREMLARIRRVLK